MMRLIKSKKGIDFINWIFKVMLLYVVLMAIVLFSMQIRYTILNTGDVAFFPLSQRFLYSSNCFVYEDVELGRAFPGIMDYSKVTQERMDQCFVNQESKMGAKVTVKMGNENISVYHKKELFIEYSQFAPISSSIHMLQRRFPVTVIKEGEKIPGILQIQIGWYK